MNNRYSQHPLKSSLKFSESISAFRALVGNTKRVFAMFWLCTHFDKLCLTPGHEFSKATYPAVRNSSRFSTEIPFEFAEMSV